MSDWERLLGRVLRFAASERVGLIVGLIAILVAAGIGLVMGGVMLVGIVGVLVAVVGFVLLKMHRRRHGEAGRAPIGVAVAHFALAAVVVLAVIQLVPYGRSHSNPPITGEPDWSSSRTRELMVNACFGCHSNEVEWPWYSNVAPISWVVTAHVDEGRDEVNYSEFATDPGEAEETIEVIRDGSMPPSYYTVFGLHPEARLTAAEIDELLAGLASTPGMDEDDDD